MSPVYFTLMSRKKGKRAYAESKIIADAINNCLDDWKSSDEEDESEIMKALREHWKTEQ